MRRYLTERVGPYAVVQIYADGFEQLARSERVLAYYLSEAALAGRDIYYDQNHRKALAIRDLLEELVLHRHALAAPVASQILEYTKLFWINSCQYHERTKQKFVPRFRFQDLVQAARDAWRDGARFGVTSEAELQALLDELRPFVFDASFEPAITSKNPPQGNDIVTASANNFYHHVTLADVEAFAGSGEEQHPLNSRLVKTGARLIEEVYCLEPSDGPHRYADEIATIVSWLERALPQAGTAQRQALESLIAYYRDGSSSSWRRFNVAWLAYREPVVDTINGFIEVYKDARGQKGAFEGIVHYVDATGTAILRKLAQHAQYFEDRTPFDAEFKRRNVAIPVATAVNVAFATGDGGPMCSIGINLPNEQEIRATLGSKSVSLANVMRAGDAATLAAAIDEFAPPEDREIGKRHADLLGFLKTSMHEVLGHAAGQASLELKGEPSQHLREYYSALEEARAELLALHHMSDPKLIELGILPSTEVAQAGLKSYARDGLLMLRRIKGTDVIEDDHMRAMQLIVTYLREACDAIVAERIDGKLFYRVPDVDVMRRHVADLLRTLQRIKATGDYAAARRLIEEYAIHVNLDWRDEVVARAQSVGLHDYTAFVMPEIMPIRDATGTIVDARVAHDDDFVTQMLKYGGKIARDTRA